MAEPVHRVQRVDTMLAATITAAPLGEGPTTMPPPVPARAPAAAKGRRTVDDGVRPPTAALPDLSSAEDVPLHQRLTSVIADALVALALPSGQRIWSENQLMERFGVSRHVVRQALNQLVLESRLYSRKGAGHFVNGRRLHRHLPVISSISADLAASGESYSLELIDAGLSDRILDREADLISRSRLPRVLRVRRLGRLEGEPVALVTGSYPARLARILTMTAVGARGVYATLDAHGIGPHAADVTIRFEVAEPVESALLGIGHGTPLICVASRARTGQGRLIEITRELYRADRFEFSYEATIGAR